MTQQETDKLIIDGSGFTDLDLGEVRSIPHSGIWAFLGQIVPVHPWIAGITAILGVLWIGADQSALVMVSAIIGISIVTVTSICKRDQHGRTQKASESNNVRTDTVEDRSLERTTRQ